MECSKNLKLLSFAGVSDVKMMKWLLNLILMLPVCNTMGCGGDRCYAIAVGNSCGLKCPDCGKICEVKVWLCEARFGGIVQLDELCLEDKVNCG